MYMKAAIISNAVKKQCTAKIYLTVVFVSNYLVMRITKSPCSAISVTGNIVLVHTEAVNKACLMRTVKKSKIS